MLAVVPQTLDAVTQLLVQLDAAVPFIASPPA